MNPEKEDTTKKKNWSDQNKFDNQDSADKKKDIDSQRHPEEQNVDAKEYMPKDKKNLNGSPEDQRI